MAAAVIAAPSQAAWSPAVDLGPASRVPVIAFSPAGDAALAWGLNTATTNDTVTVVRHGDGGPFTGPASVATGTPDPGRDLQITLAADGAAILRTGARVFVAPAGSSAFGPGQDLGGVQEGDLGPPEARLTPTLAGETIAGITSSQDFESAAVLAPGATRFGAGQSFIPFDDNIGTLLPVATDTAGTAFIAGDDLDCGRNDRASVGVAVRLPHGRFGLASALPCRPVSVPGWPDPVISAAGSGRAVVLAVTGTTGHYVLWVIIRTHGRFGAPHVLARSAAGPNPLGPAVIGLDGKITAAWQTCAESGIHCTVTAARGSLRGGRWQQRTYSARGDRIGLGGQVGDGYVVLSRCAGSICRLSVVYAGRRGRFGDPVPLTADGQLVFRDTLTEASSGRRRVRIVVWSSSRGGVFAAVAAPGRPRLGAVRRLAPDGSGGNYGPPAYETGPRDQAIVAWLTGRATASATVYSP